MGDVGGVASSSSTSLPGGAAAAYASVFHNYPLLAALIAFALAQSTKFFTTCLQVQRKTLGCQATHWIWWHAIIPLCYSYISCCSYWVTRWLGWTNLRHFNDTSMRDPQYISKIFHEISWQVMHDAFGVRLHAGRQAEVLNQIVFELPMEHPLANTRPLRELLGHTPLQVIAGAVLGFVTAVIAHLINKAAS